MRTLVSLSVLVLCSACMQPRRDPEPPSPPPPAHPTAQAQALLKSADGRPSGRVTLAPSPDGVHLALAATGLTPGPHGFHIHAGGACAPGPDPATGGIVAFGAAGPHFDPGMSHNHGRPDDPPDHAHAGELPNARAGADGSASLEHLNRNVTLGPGDRSIMGRTLVVHADADDYRTDPSGNSGARVLCGVVEPVTAGPVTGRTTLPGANVYPEGVAVDPSTGDRYVGSSKEGHLYKLAPGATEATVFQHGGSPGRQAAFGLKIDDQRRLWIAGGPNGTVAVVDLASATTRAVMKVPPGPQTFVNDLVVSGSQVYVTDSFRPVIYRASTASMVLEPWLDLATTPVRYRPNEVNLNGIVASPDGRFLVAVQLATGQLWRIDTRTRAVTEVAVEGGPLPHGDGLVLRGASDLFVVRNEEREIVHVMLSVDGTRGRIVQRLGDPRLRYPTTAALVPEGLVVVNGQLDRQKGPPPLLPFDVVTVAVPR